jgi:hypothetical protein
MVFILCSLQPRVTSVNLPWDVALELPLSQRDTLLEILDEQRNKEVSAMKSAMRTR